LIEIPWNIFGSSLIFLCWYWAVGFPVNRTGYTYLVLGVVFPIYYSSFALAIATASPSAEAGNIMYSTLMCFILTW
jgi:ATP-binding cassette subfamily G (WHITE) protein 2 (SNQ2)